MEEEAFGRQSVGQGGESHSTSRLKASSSEEQSFRLRLPRSRWRVCTHFFFFFFLFNFISSLLSIKIKIRKGERIGREEDREIFEISSHEREEEPEAGSCKQVWFFL